MKTIILTLALVFGLTSQASDLASLNEMSVTVAQVASVDAKIAAVKLNSSGVMTVKLRDGGIKTLKLSENNQQNLLWASQMLAESELQTDVRKVVCMMMVGPFSVQDLSVFDSNTKALKVVLSSGHCAISTYTHPKDAYQLQTAQVLKAQLLVLAHQLVK